LRCSVNFEIFLLMKSAYLARREYVSGQSRRNQRGARQVARNW
jgi:hypothetical protein